MRSKTLSKNRLDFLPYRHSVCWLTHFKRVHCTHSEELCKHICSLLISYNVQFILGFNRPHQRHSSIWMRVSWIALYENKIISFNWINCEHALTIHKRNEREKTQHCRQIAPIDEYELLKLWMNYEQRNNLQRTSTINWWA